MSKGMWTKQFSLDGKAFYYNAAINRSCWAPPPDAIIHEAPNARPFTEEEIEQIRNEEAYKSFTNSTSVGTDANLIQPSINTSFPNNPMPVQSTINSRLGMVPNFYQVGTNMNSGSSFPAEDGLLEEKAIQDKINNALMEKKLKNAGRRFRATEQKTEEDSVTAEYLRQKAELENQAGSKDGSNWLVR